MFLARPILDGIVVNYVSLYDLPWSMRQSNSGTIPRSRNVVKNPEDPVTEYHTWMEKNGVVYDRDAIIKQYKKNNRNFKADSKKSTSKRVVKKRFGQVVKRAVGHEVNAIRPTAHVERETFSDEEEVFSDDDDDDDEQTSPMAVFGRIEPVAAPAPAYNPVSQMSRAEKETKMFDLFTDVGWCDKDSGIRRSSSLSRVDQQDLRQLMPIMVTLADKLKVAVNNCTAALETLSAEESYNFLFHVIAKGRQVYFSCITDPEFCTYLIPTNQYQPLYTILKNKFRIAHHDDI